MINSQGVQNKLLIILSLVFLGVIAHAQSFKTITSLGTINSTATTADKPQSKVWFYGGYWWTVAPVSGGTYIYRLDGTSWTQLISISSMTSVKADIKVSNDTAYILLCSSNIPALQNAQLIRAIFNAGSPPTYTLGTTTSIQLDSYSETSTIDIDSKWIMWLASDGGGTAALSGLKKINVRWSSYPYTTWSDSITLETGVEWDDICAITAFTVPSGSRVGVLWSDQTNEWFKFKYHIDGDSKTTWYEETAVSDGSSGGVEDDHINFAVASDGTIYAAVKTSYSNPLLPTIGLLVRRPAGTWDPLYTVTKFGDAASGTRPIALLNEVDNKITVIYTQKDGGSDIVYKESSTSSINFPDRQQYLRFGTTDYNNVSSTKQNYTDSVVVLFSTGTTGSGVWNGVIAKRTSVSTTNGAGYSLSFDGTNDFLRMENNSTINLTGSLTIEAWINPSSLQSRSILNKTSGSSNGYELAITSAGKVTFRIDNTTLTSTLTYSANTWTHIAATFNSSGGSMKIYINGVLDPNTATSSLSGNTDKLLIGGDINFFNGSLDEIRLWNTVRTETQIQANMCQKLAGSESNLIGYWNFDTPEGLNVPDKTSNNNYATMHDMANYVYDWSGAAIGDESASDYDPTGGFTQNLSHSDGDDITATTTGGTITGLQLYRVDSTPLRTGATNTADTLTTISPYRFWGVKVIGSSSPTYTLTYNYDGHPGIFSESGLNLLFRDNLADDTWSELYATLNTSTNTLTKTGLTGTEFALASSVDPLPVELSSFSAQIINKNVILNWETATEVRNYGFDVEKSFDGKVFIKLGFVQGNGNSNSNKYYSFEDNSPETGINYYRLKQIDTDGSFEYSKIISINLNVPTEFTLSQNYPNPFNPTTTIDFTLPSDTFVSLKVYDLLGNETTSLISEPKEAGSYSLQFDGTNLASGNYIYVINAGGKIITKKMTLLK